MQRTGPRPPAGGSPARRPPWSWPGRAARGKRFVILASQFHEPLSRALIDGAVRTLRRHGASSGAIRVLWVPGAFELPVVAARLVRRRPRPHAVIALGALIKGDTPQYEVLANAVATGLTEVSVRTGVPVSFGIIVAATPAQAGARAGLPAPRQRSVAGQAGGTRGNRGQEAALAALAVLRLLDTRTVRSR
jgi:6,7-dimethyl-8-ribityllumazine synthase